MARKSRWHLPVVILVAFPFVSFVCFVVDRAQFLGRDTWAVRPCRYALPRRHWPAARKRAPRRLRSPPARTAPFLPINTWETGDRGKGTLDTSLEYDGYRAVHVASRLGDDVSTCDMNYLVLNGRAQPYRADAPAKLSFDVRGCATEATIVFNDKPHTTTRLK